MPVSKASPKSNHARDWAIRISLLCLGIWLLSPVVGFERCVTMITTIGLLASIVGIASPVIGVYGITILCTLDAMTRVFVLTGGIFRWNTVNYLLLIVVMLGVPILIRRKELNTKLLAVFVAYLTILLLTSPDRAGGFQHLLGAFSYFGILVYFVRGTKDSSVWHWTALVSNSVAALGGMLYFLNREGLPYINANAWAYFPLTALFTACIASVVPSNLRRLKLLILILAIVNIVWVLLTGSRGGITMASCCLMHLISGIPSVSKRVMFLVTGIAIGMVVVSQFAEQQEYVLHRLDKSVDSEKSLASRTSGRSDLMIGGWRIFLENPVLGVGTGGYATHWFHLKNRTGLSDYASKRKSEAHSGWVKTLAEAGILGIALHIAFVLSFAAVGMRSRKRNMRMLGVLVSLALAVAFISTEFQGKGLWFISAAAAVVMCRKVSQSSPSETWVMVLR